MPRVDPLLSVAYRPTADGSFCRCARRWCLCQVVLHGPAAAPNLVGVAGPTFVTSGEAATAFTRNPEQLGQHDIEVIRIVTDGPWAIAELAATRKNGTQSHPIVFVRHVEDGWTVIGAASNGSGWTAVPHDHSGHDRRKGIAGFTMAVPHKVEELRVSYRPRRPFTSPQRHLGCRLRRHCPHRGVGLSADRGVTRIDARRGYGWERLDHSRLAPAFEPLSQRLVWWLRARRNNKKGNRLYATLRSSGVGDTP